MKPLTSLPRCPMSRRVQRLTKVSLAALLIIFLATCFSGQNIFQPVLELNLVQTSRTSFSTPHNILNQHKLNVGNSTEIKALPQVITRKDDPLFVNVTLFRRTQSLVELIKEENYLAHNKSIFNLDLSINNTLDYGLLIDGSGVCAKNEKVYLLIIIPSVAGDFERRAAIRRTWLGVRKEKLHSQVLFGFIVKHIFLLGLRPRANWKRLQAESRRHGDIVLAGFLDTYRNLTTKVLVGFNWVIRNCPQAQIVLKVDQDTLINMPLMLRLLYNIQYKAVGASTDFVLGLPHRKPVVRRKGKWGVSETLYPLAKFPVYLYGHTYAVSSPSGIARLLKAGHHFPLLAPEDAFITGVLAKSTGLVRLASSAFTVCCRHLISRCELVWNQRAAFTGLDSVALLESLWMDIKYRTCNPKQHYKQIKPKNDSNVNVLDEKG